MGCVKVERRNYRWGISEAMGGVNTEDCIIRRTDDNGGISDNLK